MVNVGRISSGGYVLSAGGQSLTVTARDPSPSTAPALPGVADPAKPHGAKISVRLLETYGADRHSMQHEAA